MLIGVFWGRKMTTMLQKKQSSHGDASTAKPKERRIVTWTQEVFFSLKVIYTSLVN